MFVDPRVVTKNALANLALLLGLVLAGCAVDARPAPSSKPADQDAALVARTFMLTKYCQDLDGQWQGSIFASDGKVYFASLLVNYNSQNAFVVVSEICFIIHYFVPPPITDYKPA